MWFGIDVSPCNSARAEEVNQQLRQEGYEVIFNRRLKRIWVTGESKYTLTIMLLKFSDCNIITYQTYTDVINDAILSDI